MENRSYLGNGEK